MSQRVYVTGMGTLNACGKDIATSWQAICEGHSGIKPITTWDTTNFDYPLAGEISDYNPASMVKDRKLLKLLSRLDTMGLIAASMAIEHSEVLAYRAQLSDPEPFNYLTGIYAASYGNKYNQQYEFMPLISASQDDLQYFGEHLFESVNPMWLLKILPNNVLAYTGLQYNFKGANQTMVNHVAGGIQAIIEAYHAIRNGQVERAVVVGYDGFEPQSILYYSNLGLMSKTAVKSFDMSCDGMIVGEGAGALFLESEKAAEQRNAKCYAEILGGGATSEAMGIFDIDEHGIGLAELMQHTLATAKLSTHDIGMITSHGNANHKADASEAMAITEVFGSGNVPVTGFKWALGHTLCSAASIESIFTICALQQKIVPGIVTLRKPAPECQSLAISATHQIPRSDTAMLINRGFGSLNGCLLIKACPDG